MTVRVWVTGFGSSTRRRNVGGTTRPVGRGVIVPADGGGDAEAGLAFSAEAAMVGLGVVGRAVTFDTGGGDGVTTLGAVMVG